MWKLHISQLGASSEIWKALGHYSCACQALMMRLITKCVISAWGWVLALSFSNVIVVTKINDLVTRTYQILPHKW